jgi:hypothetical protein
VVPGRELRPGQGVHGEGALSANNDLGVRVWVAWGAGRKVGDSLLGRAEARVRFTLRPTTPYLHPRATLSHVITLLCPFSPHTRRHYQHRVDIDPLPLASPSHMLPSLPWHSLPDLPPTCRRDDTILVRSPRQGRNYAYYLSLSARGLGEGSRDALHHPSAPASQKVTARGCQPRAQRRRKAYVGLPSRTHDANYRSAQNYGRWSSPLWHGASVRRCRKGRPAVGGGGRREGERAGNGTP